MSIDKKDAQIKELTSQLEEYHMITKELLKEQLEIMANPGSLINGDGMAGNTAWLKAENEMTKRLMPFFKQMSNLPNRYEAYLKNMVLR